MTKRRESRSAIAGVEASDTRYKAGVAETTRRRTLVLRIRPLGLWVVVGFALAPSLLPALTSAIRIGFGWLLAIFG